MKNRLLVYFIAFLSSVFMIPEIYAQKEITRSVLNNQVKIKNPEVRRQGERVYISILFDLRNLKVTSNSLYTLTPVIKTDGAEKKLPAIQLTGRKKDIYLKRNPKENAEKKIYQSLVYDKNSPKVISYSQLIPYEDWMENSSLSLIEEVCDCAFEKLSDNDIKIRTINLTPIPFDPFLAYVRPKAEELKRRDITQSIFLEYEVNQTNIDAGFRRNLSELDKLNKFVSTARSDKNIKIQKILIHGYASPDGPYQGNEFLSKERAISMMNYIKSQYNLKDSDLNVESTGEDWAGLRERVVASNLYNKDAIIKIIDGTHYAPDPKEWLIKSTYPHDYRKMQIEIYPFLRRSDCTIDFIARNFNLQEAKKIIKTNPVQLSLNEMYLVAETYPVGSEEFNDVFEVAARLFPNDSIACLNVANTALSRGDLIQAKKFIKKAPRCPETDNAKGVIEMLEGKLDIATKLFEKAIKRGLKDSKENVFQIQIRNGVIEAAPDEIEKRKQRKLELSNKNIKELQKNEKKE